MTSMTPQEPTAHSPPVAASLAGVVPGGEPLEHDTLDLVSGAGGEEIVHLDPGKPGDDTGGPGQGKRLKCRPALGVGQIDQELAVEPERSRGGQTFSSARWGRADWRRWWRIRPRCGA